MLAQRCCKLCGETFEIERKRGGQRVYCFVCSPPGWQLVKVPNQTRLKLRRVSPVGHRVPKGMASVTHLPYNRP
jgi:hypothetical protein